MRRFDPDALSPVDWEHVEAIDHHGSDPTGLAWPEGTGTLTKLAVWAAWGLYLDEQPCGPDSGLSAARTVSGM